MLLSWRELEAAFCDTSRGVHRYFDLGAGRLVALNAHLLGDSLALQRVSEDPGRFVRIETIPSHEQHEWLTHFAAMVQDPDLRARLTETLGNAGVFRRFKQILRQSPVERQRWLDRRSEILRDHIGAWLRARGITVDEQSSEPFARSAAPETPHEAAALRRLARDELEDLPAEALPLAVGLLRYLEAKAR
ncbi:MAG: hypothetical protein H0T76_02065 [Nannocystis sp.]|nr:UPF0158 family protein [Nannocystis sp.]MBA3545247.1 hypothetical protein [Nannocystis sp.]